MKTRRPNVSKEDVNKNDSWAKQALHVNEVLQDQGVQADCHTDSLWMHGQEGKRVAYWMFTHQ